MTIFQRKSMMSDIGKEPIPIKTLAYFRGRLGNRIHELVIELFSNLEQSGKLSRAELGRRIGKAPEQITRWLGSPGNWTQDTLSDLVLGMGYEPVFSLVNLNADAVEVQASTFSSAEKLVNRADQSKNFGTITNAAGAGDQTHIGILNISGTKPEAIRETKFMALGSIQDVLAREDREREAA